MEIIVNLTVNEEREIKMVTLDDVIERLKYDREIDMDINI